MPILPGAHNIIINNSSLVDWSQQSGPSGIQTLLESSIPEAAHDSSARHPPPRCSHGTREQLIKDITCWALATDGPPILWVKGPAGVGKSALAQTCAEKMGQKMGAAFFFSRPNRREDDSDRFFTSLAYQFSTRLEAYCEMVDKKIRRDRTLVTKSMSRQFEELIVQPFQELKGQWEAIGEMIVFVDGLDDCSAEAAQCEIIEIIAASTRGQITPFRWAFFSRPEPHIEATFSTENIATLCQQSILSISRETDGDIELYLRVGFQSILRQHNLTRLVPWPSDDIIRILVDAAAGLFVYAATIIRFVGQSNSLGPEEQLQVVLAVISDNPSCVISAAQPFAELDTFYMLIMESVPHNILPSLQLLLLATTVTPGSRSGWCAQQLANVVGLKEFNFRTACNKLRAVLCLQERPTSPETLIDPSINQDQPFKPTDSKTFFKTASSIFGLAGYISFYHKSFIDFLSDPNRSKAFCIRTPALANIMFRRCLEIHRHYASSHYYDPVSGSLRLTPDIPNSATLLAWPAKSEYVNSFLKNAACYAAVRMMLRLHCSFDLDHRLLQNLEDLDYCKIVHLYDLYCGSITSMKTFSRTVWEQIGVDERILQKMPRKLIRPYRPSIVSWFFVRPRSQETRYTVGHGHKRIFVCLGDDGDAYFVASRPVELW